MSSICFSNGINLSEKRIERVIESHSKKNATHISVWEKIKDWFYGTNLREALGKLYDLTHHNGRFDTESACKKVIAFYQLKQMACPGYQDRFQAHIAENENGTYTFFFSIEGAMNEFKVVYGSPQSEVDMIEKRELTNNSEILEKNTVISQLKYDCEQNKLEGISSANQRRVGLHLLDDTVKQKMAMIRLRPKNGFHFQ